ncbi:DUF4240 domain-containing protein [Actinacidiphila rubida]|uniref:DUF4240 domain-containing protein n=1 Tax=Actinacidiphila rubida TaxID=310780 RepID=A0A1H8EE85_9ACTN|nr:DUF4240 domain-containing protein [Actinacidiphila rubida]SEN17424.1 Protein of unknown function [Actinacidiphila rubida]
MDNDAFWELVEDSLRHSPSRSQREAFLTERLAALPPDHIVLFQTHLDIASGRAYTWDLWGAAMRIFGGWCSDDGFKYFRLWLIGRGRQVFDRAVVEPDALTGLPEVQRLAGRHRRTWSSDVEWPEWESLDYVAAKTYDLLAGDDDECTEGFYDAVEVELGGHHFNRNPVGERWDARDEATSALKVPRLTEMFSIETLR